MNMDPSDEYGFVNPGKSIHAPYSQDNVDVFAENAG